MLDTVFRVLEGRLLSFVVAVAVEKTKKKQKKKLLLSFFCLPDYFYYFDLSQWLKHHRSKHILLQTFLSFNCE